MPKQIITVGPESIPGTDYDVQAAFGRVGTTRRFAHSLGVMNALEIEGNGIAMDFLHSRQFQHHDDLLHSIGYTQSPIADIEWQGSPFTCAVRYETGTGQLGALSLKLMIDGGTKDQDVRAIEGYKELRTIIVLGSALVIAKRELLRRTAAPIRLKTVSGFQTPSQRTRENLEADNLTSLSRLLR